MTMLDRMRRHKGWLKWSLALVVLAFIIFYIPDFLGGDVNGTTSPSDEVARVDGRSITVAEFSRAYQNQLQAYRAAYGQNINEQLLRQLGFEQQILQQLIEQEAAIVEAARLGITVNDDEVRHRILAMPGFQDNGQFIGETRYRQVLDMQRPPMTPSQFEASLRQQLVLEKLRAVVTDWVTVADAEADAEYTKRTEKIKVDLVHISAETFRSQVTASDADIAAYFDAHKEKYRVGERRKIRYLLIDEDLLRGAVTVPAREVERYYNNNIELYTTPEQVRASHILFKTEEKDEAAVRAGAEKVLAQVKQGGDFAELAKKYSEDEQSQPLGGDLDYFGQGRMVPEFDAAAFAMTPGAVSDLVKTPFGFHIIKVVDKKPTVVRSLDEVRTAITEQLKTERVQRQATALAGEIGKTLKTPADLDKAAAARGWQVQESAFFAREEPILGLGASPQVTAEIFELKEGEVSSALRAGRGLAFATLTGRQDPAIPKLDDVKTRVNDDVVTEKASTIAGQKAAALAAALKSATDFAAAARKAGVEAKSSDLIARGTALPDVGFNQAVETAVFALSMGAVSDPIQTLDGTTIVKVTERKGVTADELRSSRD
ncbi:MAG: SurA N-terminal domain-containing protein, partial [Vicinamibacterales bacterium]|nr:SurA N-terminal domain-containing protein [Vicinamibacterales bacterium]